MSWILAMRLFLSLCVKKKCFEIAKEMHAFSMNKISTSNELYIIWIIQNTFPSNRQRNGSSIYCSFFFLIETRRERNRQKSFSAVRKTNKQRNTMSLHPMFRRQVENLQIQCGKNDMRKANFIWVDYLLFQVWYCLTIFKLNDDIGCVLKTRARNHLTKIISVHFRRKKNSNSFAFCWNNI